MNRKNVKRVLVALGVAAGVLATAASPAAALGGNHSEPTLRRD